MLGSGADYSTLQSERFHGRGIAVLVFVQLATLHHVIGGNGVNAKVKAPLVHDFMTETLEEQHLFQIVTVVFPTFIGNVFLIHLAKVYKFPYIPKKLETD